jgi:hypothetical protein
MLIISERLLTVLAAFFAASLACLLALGMNGGIAFAALALFILVTGMKFFFLNIEPKLVSKYHKSLIFIVAVLFMVSEIKLIYFADYSALIKPIAYVAFTYSMLSHFLKGDADCFLKHLSIILFLYGCLMYVLPLAGVAILENYPAAFMLPLALLICADEKSTKKTVFVFLVGLAVFANFTGSRTTFFCCILLLVLFLIHKLPRIRSVALVVAVSFITTFTLLVIFNDRLFYLFNELLTYRPTLWKFYVEGVHNIYIGDGVGSSYIGQDAADNLSQLLGRGVAEAYGAHSYFILLFQQHGLLGLALSLFILVYAAKESRFTSQIYLYPALCIAALTSIYIGNPNIYGLIFLMAISMPTTPTDRKGAL